MGKMQRTKGGRVERLLVKTLNTLGYEALRVPLSGASKGYKGDVIVKVPETGAEYLIEVKSRKDSFKSLYAFLSQHKGAHSLWLDGNCVDIGLDIDVALNPHGIYRPASAVFPDDKRTLNRLVTFKKWLGEAEILVLKDNNKPFIYLRYR